MRAMRLGAAVAAVVACIGLQGCAATGGTQPASNWHATGANTAMSSTPAKDQPVVRADTKENFAAVVAAIHKQMEPGGRWQFVSTSERSTIDGKFADMQKLYDKYGSVDKMDANSTMQLAVDQGAINAILTKKDGNRLICESSLPVGSHLPVKTCKTFAQIQQEQRGTQNQLMQKTQQGNWQQRSSH